MCSPMWTTLWTTFWHMAEAVAQGVHLDLYQASVICRRLVSTLTSSGTRQHDYEPRHDFIGHDTNSPAMRFDNRLDDG